MIGLSNAGVLIPYKRENCGALARDDFYNFGLLTDEFDLNKGCVILFNFSNGHPMSDWVPYPSCQHVGLAISDVDSNGNFKSIEGNTGGSSGGAVLIQTRNIKDVSCVGHPKYTKEITADMVIATAKKDEGYYSPTSQINKFNTWFYGADIGGDWCATAVCYWFYHTETGGGKSNMIDVSSNNGTIDWKKVKADGVTSAIIRIGWGDLSNQKDSKFEENYKNAKANGIKVGGYWVCYCGDEPQLSDYVADAKLEAKVCLSIIKGKTFDLPIFHDIEVKSTQTKKIQSATMAFCKAIQDGGYRSGVYASNSFFDAYLDYKAIKAKYSTWVAQWGVSKCSKDCDIWQYSETGSINGISTNVDLDKQYKRTVTVIWRVMGKGYDNRVGQVKDLQRILIECGYACKVTGIYDDDTEQAVKDWQKKHNHPVTGVMDEVCIKDLLSSD